MPCTPLMNYFRTDIRRFYTHRDTIIGRYQQLDRDDRMSHYKFILFYPLSSIDANDAKNTSRNFAPQQSQHVIGLITGKLSWRLWVQSVTTWQNQLSTNMGPHELFHGWNVCLRLMGNRCRCERHPMQFALIFHILVPCYGWLIWNQYHW